MNAVVESVSITNDDPGLLSTWLYLDYGGYGQGFGGYALYLPNNFKHSEKQGAAAGHFIWRCMEIADVTEWAKIKGKTIRVDCAYNKIHRIGHILKDIRFDPSAEFKEMEYN